MKILEKLGLKEPEFSEGAIGWKRPFGVKDSRIVKAIRKNGEWVEIPTTLGGL